MNSLKWLLCFLLVPFIIVLAFVVVVLFIRYFYIMIPLCIIGIWVYLATGMYEDWF